MSVVRDLWFLNTRVSVLISCEDGTDKVSVLEHRAPHGDSPPLHVHRTEDEIFHLLEGELTFSVNGGEQRAGAGQTLLVHRGTPHSYRVDSPAGARWLTVTAGEDFERFVRALGRPAEGEGLPQPSGPPTPEQAQALTAVAAKFGVEIVGPPRH